METTGKERSFGMQEFIVSKTDLTGKITYGNELFISISGYEEKELLGKAHSILRHPDMPRAVFKLLWDTISSGKEIFAYVINRAKDGSFYWVFAQVTPSFDENGKIIAYHSVRRKPSKAALDKIIPIYKQMLDAEKTGGIEASTRLLTNLLQQSGHSYESFIFSL